jgi:predicted Zn-dependent peptidase
MCTPAPLQLLLQLPRLCNVPKQAKLEHRTHRGAHDPAPIIVVMPVTPALHRPAVRSAVLDNGLKVLVQEVHTAPLASVWCWYKVGSKDEGTRPDGRFALGGAHELQGHHQHPARPGEGHHRAVRRQAGTATPGSTRRRTLETATRDALDRMLFIEAERMANCLYDPEDCESERTVIISELQGGENDPDQLLEHRGDQPPRFKRAPLPAPDDRLARAT